MLCSGGYQRKRKELAQCLATGLHEVLCHTFFMKITPIYTEKITDRNHDLFAILDTYIQSLQEKSVVAISSKIVSICEGRIVKIGDVDKARLIYEEAEYYLPPEASQYHFTLAIRRNILIPTAGIDESNGNGYYILWPSDPQKTANEVREYLCRRFTVQEVGVVITDSKTTPLRWGTTGVALTHSGFLALNNYRGEPDIFGRIMKVTNANVMDALAVAAVLTMGEGNEQTPLALIEDVPHITFQKRNPSEEELADLRISLDDDLYAPLLKSAGWRKGKKHPEEA